MAAFAADPRVEGVLVVGSGAAGYLDERSDVDLAVVLRSSEDVARVAREWGERLEAELAVVHRFGDDLGPAGYLVGLLLEGFLEVDLGFLSTEQMADRGMPWTIAFDRRGEVERRQRSLPPARVDLAGEYRRRVDGVWHWLMRGGVAVERGRALVALAHVDEVRERALELARIRRGIAYKDADALPADVRERVARALPRSLDAAELARALCAAADAFFAEARALDALTGEDVAARVEPVVVAYLDQLRLPPARSG